MINQIVTRVSLESFRERARDKKVVILYPWTNYRNLFLSHFLASANEGLLYYRIPNDVGSLEAWLADMAQELDEVLDSFGKSIRKALESPSPQSLGEAFANDLNAQPGNQVTLFVDELDHVPFDEGFNTFINAFVAGLQNNRQIAFSSRLLTHQPWYDMVVDGTAVVLGTERRKNDVIFTLEDEVKPQLEVYGFGRGHAIANGQEVTNWDGALPRNLFFYFLDNELVTRDDIFTTFWPNLSVKEATNVFHVTKRKISERISLKLEGEEDIELTNYQSGFYMPSDAIVRHFDVTDFQESVELANTTLDEREKETLCRRAVDLYKAPFLETIDMPWIVARRQHLQQLFVQALIGLARICRPRGDQEEALGYLTRALKEVPTREDIHREVMQIYIDLGMQDEARDHFKILEQILDETLEVRPSAETQALFDRIKA